MDSAALFFVFFFFFLSPPAPPLSMLVTSWFTGAAFKRAVWPGEGTHSLLFSLLLTQSPLSCSQSPRLPFTGCSPSSSPLFLSSGEPFYLWKKKKHIAKALFLLIVNNSIVCVCEHAHIYSVQVAARSPCLCGLLHMCLTFKDKQNEQKNPTTTFSLLYNVHTVKSNLSMFTSWVS